VKLTGIPYSYVRERPPLKCTQTPVCQKSYTGTHTLPDSYSCLRERSLSQSPEDARWPVALVFIVLYSYSPEGVTCLTQPTPYQLDIAIFPTPSHLAPSFGVKPFEFSEKLYGFWN